MNRWKIARLSTVCTNSFCVILNVHFVPSFITLHMETPFLLGDPISHPIASFLVQSRVPQPCRNNLVFAWNASIFMDLFSILHFISLNLAKHCRKKYFQIRDFTWLFIFLTIIFIKVYCSFVSLVASEWSINISCVNKHRERKNCDWIVEIKFTCVCSW